MNELEAEVDLFRNSAELKLQEMKRVVRLEVLEELKAREVALDEKKKMIDELMKGTAKLVVNHKESLNSRTLNALQNLSTEVTLLRTSLLKQAIKAPPQKSS